MIQDNQEGQESWYCEKHDYKIVIIKKGIKQSSPPICQECYKEKSNNQQGITQVEQNGDPNGKKYCGNQNLIQGWMNKFRQLGLVITKQFNKKKQSIKLVQEPVEQPIHQQPEKKTDNNAKKIKLVSTIYKAGYSRCLAFKQSLMFVGCHKQIRILYFNKRKLLQKLSGHDDDVEYIVLSKKRNWFVSCSWDMIICWKLEGSYWISIKAERIHANIQYLILNNEENELIQTSRYDTTLVWDVDDQKIKFKYGMGCMSKGVDLISLNQSGTALVTCSAVPSVGSQIILWTKGQNNKWEYTHCINSDFGGKLSFVSDTEIFFQPCYSNITKIFKLENTKLVLQKQTITLRDTYLDMKFFKTIYNKRRQVIVQNYGFYVNFIQRQLDGSYKTVLQPINCLDAHCTGSMTEDGEYLVIFLTKNYQIRVYKIMY